MRNTHLLMLALLVAFALVGCGGGTAQQPTATPESRPTSTPRPTAAPTATPAPTIATGSSSGQLRPVVIDRLVTFQHPNGLFSIDVPDGWNVDDSSTDAAALYLWTDEAENALIIVSVSESAEQLTQDELQERLTSFVESFSGEQDFSMDPPEQLQSGGVQIIWSYTAQASGGVQARLLANSFIYQNGDKISLLTFGIPNEQFDDLKDSLNDILNSYEVDPSVPLSADSAVNRTVYDFSRDDGNWSVEDTDSIRAAIVNGTYDITLRDTDIYYLTAPDFDPTTDLEVSADVLIVGDSRAGVAVRYGVGTPSDTRDYYTCWIDGNNSYGCFVSVNDRWTTLQEKTSARAIKPGQVNRVALRAEGDRITFSVNGVELQTFTDGRVTSGQPALYLENFSTEAGAVYDNVVITTPK